MTNFIFCLIFIQVSIFFIAGILLAATFFFNLRDNADEETGSAKIRSRQRRIRSFAPRANAES